MSINIEELTKKKSMKMSEKDVSKVVSKYMMKVALEQLTWTLDGFYQAMNSFSKYSNDLVKGAAVKNNTSSYQQKNNYEFKVEKFNKSSGDLAA